MAKLRPHPNVSAGGLNADIAADVIGLITGIVVRLFAVAFFVIWRVIPRSSTRIPSPTAQRLSIDIPSAVRVASDSSDDGSATTLTWRAG